MPIETPERSRKRIVAQLKTQWVEELRDHLAEMARTGVFPAEWLLACDVARQLEQTGYWLSLEEPLAAFLSTDDCAALVESALFSVSATDARTWWRNGERYRPNTTDWADLARKTADRLRAARPDEERTAIYDGPDQASIIFANEDFAARADVRRHLFILRDALRAAGIPELAFATSSDSGAWVMLVWTPSEQLLQNVLFTLWKQNSQA